MLFIETQSNHSSDLTGVGGFFGLICLKSGFFLRSLDYFPTELILIGFPY